jgi:ABC-type multidrug transport system fused ATPase/permease subunit
MNMTSLKSRPSLRLIGFLLPWTPRIGVILMLSIVILLLDTLVALTAAKYVFTFIGGGAASAQTGEAGISLAGWLETASGKFLLFGDPSRIFMNGGVMLIGMVLGAAMLRLLKIYQIESIIQSLACKLRLRMFSRALAINLNFSRTNRPGEVASLFLQDVDQLRYFLLDLIDRCFMQPIKLGVVLYLLFSMSSKWAPLGLLMLLSLTLVVHFMGAWIEKLSNKLMEQRAGLSGFVVEHLSTLLLGRIYDTTGQREKQFRDACRSLAGVNKRFCLTNGLSSELLRVLPYTCVLLLTVYGGREVMAGGGLTKETLLKMLFLFPQAATPVASLASLYLSLRISLAPARRIFRLLDSPEAFVDDPSALPFPKAFEHLELRGVGFEIDGSEILRDVDLVLEHGRSYLLQGPSGGGKTTLLLLLGGMHLASSGEVTVNGLPFGRYRRSDWLRKVAIVLQDPALMNLTVRENLTLYADHIDDKQIARVLQDVGLTEKIALLPRGLDTSTGNRGELFSGGERQRLAIARALLADPEVLLLDEPTSMVDEINRENLRALFKRISINRTLVIATHDPDLLGVCDETIFITTGTRVGNH